MVITAVLTDDHILVYNYILGGIAEYDAKEVCILVLPTASEGIPSTFEVSVGKAWVSDASYRVARLGHQVYGAIGFSLDHDIYLYYKRAVMAQSMFGSPDWHPELVAEESGL